VKNIQPKVYACFLPIVERRRRIVLALRQLPLAQKIVPKASHECAAHWRKSTKERESQNINVKQLSEQSSELVNVFKEVSINIIFVFLLKRQAKIYKTFVLYKIFCFNFIGIQKKYPSGDPIRLNDSSI
jgi:hypothetical protein